MTPVVWENPRRVSWDVSQTDVPLDRAAVLAAEERFRRHRPALSRLFDTDAVIESPLRPVPEVGDRNTFMKLDSHLPIAGSIKARGGIHEVLQYAETLLERHHLPAGIALDDPQARSIFTKHAIAVGSTGNLGLSIGRMARALGFSATVHMSSDARPWKKELLRSEGATVIEYREDYSTAVARGRAAAADDPRVHFVDDENSTDLFLGYAAAGEEVHRQLTALGITPSTGEPLTVYLPCGVGGGPGGVCFGLKLAFGDAVRCVFVEPTHAPCMVLGLATDLHDEISVGDIGLDNQTVGDGLAVGRPSRFVGKVLRRVVDACVTVSDEDMIRWVRRIYDQTGLRLEPSAAAAPAAWALMSPESAPGTHLLWATGGSMLPTDEFERYLSMSSGTPGPQTTPPLPHSREDTDR